ncbi:MAG: hypothetical protein RI946_1913 [Pseudomonadota bacterium]
MMIDCDVTASAQACNGSTAFLGYFTPISRGVLFEHMFSYDMFMARTTGSHSQTTGPRVRSVAEALFAKHGFAAVSMRQIAAEVGVQAGALYNYTPDKQSLLFSMMHDHMVELIAAWDGVGVSDDPIHAMSDFTRFHIDYHLARRDAVFIAYMELRNLSTENFRIIEDLRKSYETRLERIIEHGVDRGVFDVPDSRIATLAIIGMLTEVTTWFRHGGRLDADAVTDLYTTLVLRALNALRD